MSKDSSAEYYQDKKERLQKKARKRFQRFYRRKGKLQYGCE